MIFFRRISNSVSNFFRQGFSPLNQVKTQITRLRTNNIFTQMGQRFRMMQARFGYYADLPKRTLGISSKGGGDDDSKNGSKDRDSLEESGELRGRELGGNVEMLHRQQMRRKQRRSTISSAQHTQVHLLDKTSGKHDILHIGFGSGRTEIQHVVNGETLIFAQATPDVAKTNNAILVSALSSDVRLNGQVLAGTEHLLQGSEMNIKGRRFHVDLQANSGFAAEAHVHTAWETDIGPARRENQDAIGIYKGQGAYLFAIADGVGSGYGGDKMSEYTINYLLSAFGLNYDKNIRWEDVLGKAVINANAEIRNFLRKLQQHAGTTLTALVIDGWTATILHVGDSRLYLLRNRLLEQLTEDHIDVVPFDDEETPDLLEIRQVLAKAVGKASHINPDLMTFQLQVGDRLLLCTDGITGQIPDDELSQVLYDVSLRDVPRHLVKLSNERKNTDNASVVAIDILNEQTPSTTWKAEAQERVYVGDVGHPVQLKKIKKTNVEQQSREKTDNDDDENGLGCGCVVLSLLLVVSIVAMLWASGLLYTWLDSASVEQAVEQVVVPSQTQESGATSIPSEAENVSGTLTIQTQETADIVIIPSATFDSPPVTVTIAPPIVESGQVNIEIVSPTALLSLDVTSTVRPTNPSR